MKRYSVLKSAVHVQFKTDKQYDAKRESSSQNSFKVTQVYAVYNFNKHLAVERMWPT